MTKRFYLETVGCQMNVLDSELVAAALLQAGFQRTNERRRADIILFNTCSVRQHAEDKIYSALGRLKHIKEQRPDKLVGVLGCMAQKDQEAILRRAPHVDLVVGPGQIGGLVAMIEELQRTKGPQVAVGLPRRGHARHAVAQFFTLYDPERVQAARSQRHRAMVRVMLGCDKFCTYCIVPSVRGPEQSRPASEITAEIRLLAEQGCREITLLGQTVNSYHTTENGRRLRLADLLERVSEVPGIRRIRFVTNYPRDMTPDLLQAVRDLPKVCPYLHVPAQSGCNPVLKRMKRGYTAEQYREMLAAIHETVPQASVTSDFIVGFCGETEEDFQATVRLTEEARFKNSFIFKYSPRPGTKAVELFPDDVPDSVKRRRNHELLAVQNRISEEDNRRFIGKTVEILVDGPSKAAAGAESETAAGKSDASTRRRADTGKLQLTGRTPCDRIVVFDGQADWIGRFARVHIESVTAVTLFGSAVSVES